MIPSLCLFGGGRWSRVLLTVLLEKYPQISKIWITKNNFTQNKEWLETHKVSNVTIVSDEYEAFALQPAAAIIATASHTHAKYVKEALTRKIPVLSEKSFCYSTIEGEELISLSKQFQMVAGVNFEFMFASYLHDFAKYLKNLSISSIEIVWQDVYCETRYGEKKMGDVYTPLMYDSFQHCWSLLKFLFPDESLTINSVTYNLDSSVIIDASMFAKHITIALSRRSAQRIRRICVNNEAVVLDFSTEPGVTIISGQLIKNVWQENRPLAAVFKSFFDVINNPTLAQNWPLSISNCLEVINLSNYATQLLEEAQLACLEKRKPYCADDMITRNLLVDIFLPKLANDGKYYQVATTEEQINFSKYALTTL